MRALLGVELPGYRPVDNDAWTNEDGDVLSLHYFGLPPDLPAGLDDGPTLRNRLTYTTAQAGGGLIEASVKKLGELPALRQILKLPLPQQPRGQAFIFSSCVDTPCFSSGRKHGSCGAGQRAGIRRRGGSRCCDPRV